MATCASRARANAKSEAACISTAGERPRSAQAPSCSRSLPIRPVGLCPHTRAAGARKGDTVHGGSRVEQVYGLRRRREDTRRWRQVVQRGPFVPDGLVHDDDGSRPAASLRDTRPADVMPTEIDFAARSPELLGHPDGVGSADRARDDSTRESVDGCGRAWRCGSKPKRSTGPLTPSASRLIGQVAIEVEHTQSWGRPPRRGRGPPAPPPSVVLA